MPDILIVPKIFRTGLLQRQAHEQLIFHVLCLVCLRYLNYSDLPLAVVKLLCSDFDFLQWKISVYKLLTARRYKEQFQMIQEQTLCKFVEPAVAARLM